MKITISEHKLAVKKGDEKNGIAISSHTTNHNINWKGARLHGSTRLLEEESNGSNPDQF